MDSNAKKDKIINLIKDGIVSTKNSGRFDVDEDLYSGVSEYFDVVKKLCNELYDKEPSPRLYCARVTETNNLFVHDGRGGITKTYNVVCTDSVAFTGTIGVLEVEKDGGLQQHLNYLKLFMDYQGLPFLKRKLPLINFDFSDEKQVLNFYMDFYSALKDYFETYPMAMYDLMTGIKTVYNLPSEGILINPDEYRFIKFDNFKSVDLINNAHKFSYSLSDNTPNLKISYEGIKLMHLRTKVDYKSKKFRLRFMMETAKNFFKIFDEFSGEIKNGF